MPTQKQKKKDNGEIMKKMTVKKVTLPFLRNQDSKKFKVETEKIYDLLKTTEQRKTQQILLLVFS